MLDDLILRALGGGIGVALAAGPLGCFIVWQRMAYFGDALSHSALLGIVLGFLFGVAPMVSITAFVVLFAIVLVLMQRQGFYSNDTLLGMMSQGALALGLVLMSLMPGLRVDLMAYLFGDILVISREEIYWIYAASISGLLVLAWLWRRLLMVTIDPDLARVQGIPAEPIQMVFMVLIALLVALSVKIVGIILVTALLIIPAAAARRFARTPESMAVLAALLGVVSVAAGLTGSLHWDTPAGPSIVVAALGVWGVARVGVRQGL